MAVWASPWTAVHICICWQADRKNQLPQRPKNLVDWQGRIDRILNRYNGIVVFVETSDMKTNTTERMTVCLLSIWMYIVYSTCSLCWWCNDKGAYCTTYALCTICCDVLTENTTLALLKCMEKGKPLMKMTEMRQLTVSCSPLTIFGFLRIETKRLNVSNASQKRPVATFLPLFSFFLLGI